MQFSEKIEIYNDGTVVFPNLHDCLLYEFHLTKNSLTLIFTQSLGDSIKLNFKNVKELNFNVPNEFLVFRFNSFNIHSDTASYFYLRTALKSLGLNKGFSSFKEKYQKNFRLYYFEGGIGGNITFFSDCFEFCYISTSRLG